MVLSCFLHANRIAVYLQRFRKPASDVAWYIYCSVTHAYSDGLSGQVAGLRRSKSDGKPMKTNENHVFQAFVVVILDVIRDLRDV